LKRIGWTIIGRLIVGMFVLAILSLADVRPASAHGAMQRHDDTQNAQQLAGSSHGQAETPGSGQPCSGCPDCCAMGQCSLAGVTLLNAGSVTMPLAHQPAAYGGRAFRGTAGLGAAPAIPPPRLDA